MSEPTYHPGDRVQIKYDDDLGPVSGQTVEIVRGPNLDGMYYVRVVVTSWVSIDSIRTEGRS